jgi:hypothetical protein
LFHADYLEREPKAKRLFKKLTKDYVDSRTPPTDEAEQKLKAYSDIFQTTFVDWREELGGNLRIELVRGLPLFQEWPVSPHEEIAELFNDVFSATMSNQFPLHQRPFVPKGTTGTAYHLTTESADYYRHHTPEWGHPPTR